jgi:AhpD family alkylhydroperoxidase
METTRAITIQHRINNPAATFPDALQGLRGLYLATRQASLPEATLELVHQRISQINGCSLCLALGSRTARKAGVSEERLQAVAGWRHAPLFTEAERAALALTEAVTRLADREDAVPDAVWDEAARHYDERDLAALVLQISLVNFYNRLNVSTRQVSIQW